MRQQNTMSDVKSKKDSLAEEALTRIQEAIVSGDLRPNQRLIEVQLSRKFGMSRTPIREAIRRLQQTGYVTILPSGGAIVTEFSQKHMKEQFEIREVLETLVVKLACERATEEQLRMAREYLDQAAEFASRNDVNEYYRFDARFRDILLEACDNERLITLVKTLRNYYYLGRLAHVISEAELRRNIKQEFALISSVSERNKAGAAKAIKEILKTLSRISQTRF
jgi:DNA-binding GntR family transcriptional regulator